ncbi:hypothetical protein, partial [Oscillibacter sp.]|uniref:hypothetical protein n=1 Tax=Oscillibacter sp. TaxID=1945593 RepID=UPI0028ABEF47
DNTHTFTTKSTPTETATISGKAVCRQMLTALLTGGSDPTSYQWTRDGKDIADATSDTYTLTWDDIGKNVAVKITNSNGTFTSDAVGPIMSVVDEAKNAAYSGITQADAADESAVQAAVKTIAETAVDNSEVTVTVNTVSYTAPVAGTSADPDGTNGSYTFTVTVSDIEGSKTTNNITAEIAATAYSGVANAQAVAAAENVLKDVSDSVNVVEGASQEDKTSAVQSYVDHLLEKTPHASGVTAVVSYNDETGKYDVALSKGGETGSTTSLGITVNKISALTGTATIAGDTVVGNTLTAELTGSNNSGTLSYQWTRGGEDIAGATNGTYTLTADDIGKKMVVKITSSDQVGTVTSTPTDAVSKLDCEESASNPIILSNTDSSVTVTAIDGYEYILVAHNADISTGTWQSSNTFTGLESGTSYDIYQRVKETGTHNASAASDSVTFKTNAKPTTYTVTYSWNDGKTIE